MSEDQLRFPDWQEPLRLAILENEPILLAEKTQKIERMLRERLRRLRATDPQEPNQRAEEQALIDALHVIHVLRNNLA